ncbi:unnamed protein product [Urochloa humidicola]
MRRPALVDPSLHPDRSVFDLDRASAVDSILEVEEESSLGKGDGRDSPRPSCSSPTMPSS